MGDTTTAVIAAAVDAASAQVDLARGVLEQMARMVDRLNQARQALEFAAGELRSAAELLTKGK